MILLKFLQTCLHAFISNKKKVLLAFALFTIMFGLVGFIISDKTNGWDVFFKTVSFFSLSFVEVDNFFLVVAQLSAIGFVLFGVIALFFSNLQNMALIKWVQKKPYDLLIGLGEQNSQLLKSGIGSTPKLLIELNTNNPSIKEFKQLGLPIIIKQAEVALDEINLTHLQNAIISTGNDRQNIALATQIMDRANHADNPALYVRVDNRDLSVLFKQEVVARNDHVDIITYSLYENISKWLFSDHSILGLQAEILNSRKGYHIILVGSSNLCSEIIYHLAVLAHLPNQNTLTIHCINKNADKFCNKVEKLFTGIRQIPHLKLKAHTLDSESLSFYTDKVWKLDNLTNIIIATEDEDRNLDIAVNLQDTTYIQESVEKQLKTNVLFALYNDSGLGSMIDKNDKVFANFYTFGNLADVSTRDNLINEKMDNIAKLINYDYTMTETDSKPVSMAEIQKDWMNASLNDRESCKSQAAHIDVKLLALGLKKKQSTKALATLLETNKSLLNKKLEEDFIHEMLSDYKAENFPKTFKTQLNKLGRAEHNRWNAFHYLRGWQYNETKNKPAKRHDCLLPLEKFNTDETKETYLYDLYSIVNIPNYLAYAGFEIVSNI